MSLVFFFLISSDWRGVVDLLLGRFQVFVHAVRGGELSAEESELFNLLDQSYTTVSEQAPAGSTGSVLN